MALEIERKFKLTYFPPAQIRYAVEIKQGYLCVSDTGVVTRVRTISGVGFNTGVGYITIKAPISAGICDEYEYRIPLEDAEALLNLCSGTIISKTRYPYTVNDVLFEVDVFHDDLEGIMWAEVELDDINKNIVLPDFLGKELTGIKGLSNHSLSRNPEEARRIFESL